MDGFRGVIDSAQQRGIAVYGNTLVAQPPGQSGVGRPQFIGNQKLGLDFQPQRRHHGQPVQPGQGIDHRRGETFGFVVELQAAQPQGIHMGAVFQPTNDPADLKQGVDGIRWGENHHIGNPVVRPGCSPDPHRHIRPRSPPGFHGRVKSLTIPYRQSKGQSSHRPALSAGSYQPIPAEPLGHRPVFADVRLKRVIHPRSGPCTGYRWCPHR